MHDALCRFTCGLLCLGLSSVAATEIGELRVLGESTPPVADYLIDDAPFLAQAGRSADGRELFLDNGLVRRTWRLAPNGACVGYDNLMNAQAMLRSVRPEARVTIDGVAYDVGGLTGQPNHAFLTDAWLDEMEADPAAFQLVGFEVGEPAERFAWNRRRHAAPEGVSRRFVRRLPGAAYMRCTRS